MAPAVHEPGGIRTPHSGRPGMRTYSAANPSVTLKQQNVAKMQR
jgi:hypothetical protein